MIDDYRFGHIVIDGKEYTSDVKIFPDRVEGSWWRKSGHTLAVEDIEDILKSPPEVLIIGTGSSGVMKVPNYVRQVIRTKGIELIMDLTGKACKLFNEISQGKNVVAALHLTC